MSYHYHHRYRLLNLTRHTLLCFCSTIVLRVFQAARPPHGRSRRSQLIVDYSNHEVARPDEVTAFQLQGDNQPAGKGIVDHMKTIKFRAELFPGCPDPQLALQNLRSLTVVGSESQHKKLWLSMNRDAFVTSYVTKRSGQGQSSLWAVTLTRQIELMTSLYYEVIVAENPAPGFDISEIKVWTIVPSELVVKMGWVDEFRSDPGAGGREQALATKRAAVAASKATAGTSAGEGGGKRVRLPGPPVGVADEDWHKHSGERNKKGNEYQKVGRKKGSTLADGKVLAPPGSRKPIANNAVAVSSSVGSAFSSPATAQATAALDAALVWELRKSLAAKDLQIVALQTALAENATTAKVKDEQLRSEMRNRGNIATMAANMAKMPAGQVEDLFHVVSPLKIKETKN